jgi:hypothetical protein
MKINKWTVGLAAVGLVSLPSVLQAEEKLSPLQTALSSTVISGYVNTAARWNPGTGNANPPQYIYNDQNKQDAFSLDVVDLTIEKPLDEAKWAAGYRVDLWFGQDANTFASQSPFADSGDFAIRQAYVALRAPVGNGLDFKVGAFDSVVGYESHDAGKNPNYTRSYGTTIEPHTHTGVLASYQFSDVLTVKGGIANTYGPMINENANFTFPQQKAESYKTYMAAFALTAPESMGSLAGSTLYAGVVNGFDQAVYGTMTSWYVGATVATPIKELRVGAAFDYANIHGGYDNNNGGFAWNVAGYVSFQATEKLSLHARCEYLKHNDSDFTYLPTKLFETTATIQYDLWQNVISRVEFRWDHAADGADDGPAGNGKYYGGEPYSYGDSVEYIGAYGEPTRENSFSLIANIIYLF